MRKKAGIQTVSGTFNLEIFPEGLADIAALQNGKGIELISPDPAFCTARVIPVSVEAIPAAIILPEKKFRIHGRNIIETIAPVNLRRTLCVHDGDTVGLMITTEGIDGKK